MVLGERGGIASFVMRGRADDGVEVRGERACDLGCLLVGGNARDENPVFFAVKSA